jgi:membrane protein
VLSLELFKKLAHRWRKFFTHDLWHVDFHRSSRIRKYLHHHSMLSVLVLRSFWRDRFIDSASALVFTTLFAIVPFLAVIFTIYKLFDWQHNMVLVLTFLLSPLGNRATTDLVPEIVMYVENSNIHTLGLVGFLFLFVSLLFIISSIEKAFNDIWKAKKVRAWYRRLMDYSVIFLIGPVLALTVLGWLVSLQENTSIDGLTPYDFLNRLPAMLLPSLLSLGGFIYILKFIPNTRVRFKSALVGAVIGAILWNVGNWVFTSFIVEYYSSGAQAQIYARVAVLPLFLMWMFFGWTVLLFVAQVSYAHQNLYKLIWQEKHPFIGAAFHEMIGLKILLRVTQQHMLYKISTSEENLSDYFNIPENVINTTAQKLVDMRYLILLGGPDRSYLPAHAPETVTIVNLLYDLRITGCTHNRSHRNIDRLTDSLCFRFNKKLGYTFKKITVKDLVDKL